MECIPTESIYLGQLVGIKTHIDLRTALCRLMLFASDYRAKPRLADTHCPIITTLNLLLIHLQLLDIQGLYYPIAAKQPIR